MIKVSILVPVYGVERFIGRCARSLMEQTYDNIEYIFVDDCSLDNSIAVLKDVVSNYRNRDVQIIRHEQNLGLGSSRKTALEHSSGDFILNMDSDDYLETDAVQILVDEAEKTGADIIGMDSWFEWKDSRKEYHGQWSADPKEYAKILLSGRTLPGVCFHMIRHSLYTDNDIMPAENINTGEDYVVTPRLCYFAKKISRIERPLYHYIRINENSYTSRMSIKKIKDIYEVTEILYGFFSQKKNFQTALNEGLWLKKTCLMMDADMAQYNLIDLIPTRLPADEGALKAQEKIASRLIAKKMWYTLRLYCIVYHTLFYLLQKAKGR